MMKYLLGAVVIGFLAWASPALAANPETVKLCVPTTGTNCIPVTATNPLPISGSFSATIAGFTPNGNYGTLTATASTSASTSLPAGTVVAFQNTSAISVSCVLTAGASTATTNKIIVPGGSTVFVTVGANTTTACINQTGVASNVIALAGGAGLGTNFGGGGGSGGGGGAVTMVSGAVASGAYSSGSIASGAISAGAVSAGAYVSGSVLSGAYASGSLASGAVVDITNLSTPIAPNTATATKGILMGGQYDTTQKTLTGGQQSAVSLSPRGAQYVATGAENLVVVGAGTAGTPSGGVLTIQGVTSMTKLLVTPDSVALPANQSVNVSQINAVTPLMGNGVTGTGSQRVTIASDNTAFSVNAAATLAAETTKVIGTIRMLGNVGGVLDAIGQNVAAPANWLQTGCQFQTSPTTITAANGSPLQCNNGGKLLTSDTVAQGSLATIATNSALPLPVQAGFGVNIGAVQILDANSKAMVLDPCQYTAHVTTPVDIAAGSNTVIVAGTSAKKTYICKMMLISAGTTNVGIVQGSGSTCGTLTLGLIGGNTAAKGPNLTAQAGFTTGDGAYAVAGTTVNANDICLFNSQAVQVSGYIVTATP